MDPPPPHALVFMLLFIMLALKGLISISILLLINIDFLPVSVKIQAKQKECHLFNSGQNGEISAKSKCFLQRTPKSALLTFGKVV